MPSPNTYWRGIFDQYDRDKDGKISYAELKAIIESREYSHEFSKADVEKIMGLADTDNSGYIEYQEFIDMMHNPDLKEVFGHYVARYVNFIIPQIRPPLTGPWTGFQPVSTADGAFPIGRSRSVFKYSDGSYQAEYSCWPPAFFMILVSVVEVALFLYDVAQGSPAATGPVATLFIFNPHKRHEAWRFITCMLVHVGIIHLLVNVLVQLFLGVPLEMVHRWWRVALVYLAGVAAGSLAISVADPTSSLAGASGGVFALIAAHVATIIMNWSQIKHAIFHLLVFVVLGALSLAMAVYDRLHNRNENVSYVTHLAGAVAGLLVGIVVLRNLVTLKWEKKLWWAAFILYFSLMLAGILANIFWTKRFAKPD